MLKTIQVDMFEVQLGAAMLMQFRLKNGEVVRVMADAGVDKSSGYKIDHVFSKLFDSSGCASAVWNDFDATVEPRLNLIVGTHYDADHLLGLIPIINHHLLPIDEIWLPPVQDDQADVSVNSVSGGNANLAQKLLVGEGNTVINDYIKNKTSQIRQVNDVYRRLVSESEILQKLDLVYLEKTEIEDGFDSSDVTLENALGYFERQVDGANRILAIHKDDDHHAHDDDAQDDFEDAVDSNSQYWQRNRYRWYLDEFSLAISAGLIARGTQPPEFIALANIRKSLAKDAITAIHLDNVVKAIRARNAAGLTPATSIRCESISEGVPRYFFWNKSRFREGHTVSKKGELGFHLLGPSAQLVSKLHKKIPIGVMMMAYSDAGLKSGSVSPSNRLSYVMRFHLDEEAILISGDAGFSDFSPAGTSNYYPELLKQLSSLQVVQVAHHGGINHRFYEALFRADLPKQESWCFLLLSHAENDKTRPRAEFGKFVNLFRWDQGNDVSVLFTSQPLPAKVSAFDDLVHPPVLASGMAVTSRGDVRLGFPFPRDSSKSGTSWRVESHSVQV